MSDDAYSIRPATEADLPAVNAVYYDTEVGDEREEGAPPRRELACYPHELHTGRMFVAERAGRVIGFTSAITRSDVTYLTELFVRPEAQEQGLGHALLRAVLPEDGGIRCTMASSDIRAVGLYTIFGMQPQWPNYWIVGPTTAHIQAVLPDIVVEEARADNPALVDWDAEVSGRRRPEDHRYWVEQGDAAPLWFLHDGERVGYGFIQRRSTSSLWSPHTPTIGPLGVRDEDLTVDAVAAAVVWARRYAEVARLVIPGPHPALGALLRAGFRIVYVETFCSSARTPFFDPRRYLPSGDVL